MKFGMAQQMATALGAMAAISSVGPKLSEREARKARLAEKKKRRAAKNARKRANRLFNAGMRNPKGMFAE